MKHLLPLFFVLPPACTGDDSKGGDLGVDTSGDTDTGDTAVKPPNIVYGDPYAVMVAATRTVDSTCELDLTLKNNSDGSTVATIELAAKGCDWAGTRLSGNTQYTGSFAATGCNAADDKTYESSAFSGEEGFIFALWYTGVNIGYDALKQGVEDGDFLGGEANVIVANSYPESNVQALASDLGLAAELTTTSDDGNSYHLTWGSELNVGEVLSAFTEATGEDYVAGEPVWIKKPSWWPKCTK